MLSGVGRSQNFCFSTARNANGNRLQESAHPWSFPLECVCMSVTQLCPTFCDPVTIARQVLLFTEFSRQEYWSRLSFPSPRDLPNSGIEPRSYALQADSLSSGPPGKPMYMYTYIRIYIYLYTHVYSFTDSFEYSSPCYSVSPCC